MHTEFDVVDFFANQLLEPDATALPFDSTVYGVNGGARRAVCTVVGGTVRVFMSGTDPTASTGRLYADGSHFTVNGRSAISKFRVIKATGTPKVTVEFGS